MAECGIEGEPRPLHNGREFAWLAQSLRAPIRYLAFDPEAGTKHVTAAWKVSVDELLRNHIVIDYSPWNYPVYYIEQEGGLASVEGLSSSQQNLIAVGLFTSEQNAQQYLQDTGEAGTIHALHSLGEARRFCEQLLPDVTAVALNLTLSDGQRVAKYCFSIRTVLEKYLVEK